MLPFTIKPDVHTLKRFVFNIKIYSSFSLLFLSAFLISHLIAGLFQTGNWGSIYLTADIMVMILGVKFLVFDFFNFKRTISGPITAYTALKFSILCVICTVLLMALAQTTEAFDRVTPTVLALDAFITLSFVLSFQWAYHGLIVSREKSSSPRTKVLIVGAGEAGETLYKTLVSGDARYDVAGFVDDNPFKIGKNLHGVPVYGPTDQITLFLKLTKASKLIFAMPSAPASRIREIIDAIDVPSIDYSIVPSYIDIISGNFERRIEMGDLLNRDRVSIDDESLRHEYAGKIVMVTGAAGSIGREICRQVVRFEPKMLVILDQAETPLFFTEKELNTYGMPTAIIPVVSDISNAKRIFSVFRRFKPDIVLHAAAYKHVPMMEENIEEAVLNNVIGTKTLADAANTYKTSLFTMISTDKAVNPSSVMGLSKRVAEMYIQNLDSISFTHFVTVRFGNVLDSQGNVIEIFKKQLEQGGPITITHPEMKRYFMLTSEAAQLVLQAGIYGRGGEIFLLDMGEPVKIVDLAKAMIKIHGYEVGRDIDIVFSGIRPGEKLFEELNYNDEDLAPTPHSKIFVFKSRPHDWEVITRQIDRLGDEYLDRDASIHIMKSLVPEYRDNMEFTEKK